MLGRVLACGALGASLLCGCADRQSAAAVADLRQRLDEQQRRTTAAERKLDDLENRVFLLTDQVESQKVAALHRSSPRLPVVTLRPEERAAADEVPRTDPAAEGGAVDEVRFEGDARSSDPDHARTVLRIDGTRTAAHRLHEAKLPRAAEPDAELPSENLGVAAAPTVPAALRSPTPAAATAMAPTPVAPTERTAPASEPLALYRAAYDDLRAGRHEAAARGFREFVRRFPHHDYADNAQYWLGECFYDEKRFAEAAPEFRAVVQRWPTGNKAPDALLKLGFTLLQLGDADKARATLREVPATYPHTDAARLAVERLAQLSPMEGKK